jgi:threonylcarbamoyladenosine tRNA methylthiotransferase MtaB
MHTVAIETLGCRLNQAETAVLQRRFTERGYALTDDPLGADLYVLHTCTLTTHATTKCRRRLRWVIRRNPAACIAAIGCYAQTDGVELAGIPGVDYVIGTAEKLRLAEIIPSPAKRATALVLNERSPRGVFSIDGAGHYPLHTRANLKVQEGCDFACAFCIIPRSRGRARSRDFDDIVREARTLAAGGHREIVITGVNVGTYSERGRTLSDVIGALEDINGLERIRISSIEPTTIEDALLDRMREGGKVCPYLHVPLQSGDTRVLRAMRRRYDADDYRRFVHAALEHVPGLGLGTDVIVGFPGEDEAAFQRSCELIMEMPFVNVHVFSFSARPRTRAYAMTERVPGGEIARRRDHLHRLAQSKRAEVYRTLVGRELRVLFEAREEDGTFSGFSDQYVRVNVRSGEDLANSMRNVRVTKVDVSRGGERVIALG